MCPWLRLAGDRPTKVLDMLTRTDAMFPIGRHVEIRPRIVAALTPG